MRVAASWRCGVRIVATSVKASSCMPPTPSRTASPAHGFPSTPIDPNTRTCPPASRRRPACSAPCSTCSASSAAGAEDRRPWLRHGAWPADFFPLRHDADPQRVFENEQERYAFVSVEGDGVHEIPVGPIHAGIIEPGHFRFSIVGEKVLRLEQRLGYVHKGIERRFVGMPLAEGHRLAGRVSGDSTVAYAWAYAMARRSSDRLRGSGARGLAARAAARA